MSIPTKRYPTGHTGLFTQAPFVIHFYVSRRKPHQHSKDDPSSAMALLNMFYVGLDLRSGAIRHESTNQQASSSDPNNPPVNWLQ